MVEGKNATSVSFDALRHMLQGPLNSVLEVQCARKTTGQIYSGTTNHALVSFPPRLCFLPLRPFSTCRCLLPDGLRTTADLLCLSQL
jgi:hypothetical protein